MSHTSCLSHTPLQPHLQSLTHPYAATTPVSHTPLCSHNSSLSHTLMQPQLQSPTHPYAVSHTPLWNANNFQLSQPSILHPLFCYNLNYLSLRILSRNFQKPTQASCSFPYFQQADCSCTQLSELPLSFGPHCQVLLTVNNNDMKRNCFTEL